jgi:hypothetical protein
VSSLLVILAATVAGSAIGYALFWLRQNFDFYSHGAPLRGLVASLSIAREFVFRGSLVGLLVGATLAVIAETAPW